jgi:hypothetical protein
VAKHDELIVDPREDGRWGIKKPHAERSSARGPGPGGGRSYVRGTGREHQRVTGVGPEIT